MNNKKEITDSLKKDGEYYFVKNNKKYLLYKWEQCDGCLLLLTETDSLSSETIWQSAANNISDGIDEFLNSPFN